ncbi:MAG: pyridoxal phosphate-dependent aminotransferase [Gammaproteobacteria bacterium]
MADFARDKPELAAGRMDAVQAPIIAVIADLIKAHPGTISLGQGVVHYGPPPAAIERVRSLDYSGDIHKYGPTGGIDQLCELIAVKLATENGIRTGPECRIIVTAGSNMAFLHALFAITRPGDEIILPVPFYFNHEMAITMLDCRAVLVPTAEDYLPEPEALRRAITPRTRAIVTVSPNNPSGMVYPADVLREINTICNEHGLYHISDEAYEYFTFDGARHFSPGSMAGAEQHTISLYSLSKAYGFAAWRIGYMVAPGHLVPALYKAQDTNLICPPIVTQYAAIGALETGRSYCEQKLAGITAVRNIILSELRDSSSLSNLPAGNGAFYFLLKINTGLDDMALTGRLISEHRVAVIPGHTFGFSKGCYLRVSYGALDRHNARQGIIRLTHGLKAVVKCWTD